MQQMLRVRAKNRESVRHNIELLTLSRVSNSYHTDVDEVDYDEMMLIFMMAMNISTNSLLHQHEGEQAVTHDIVINFIHSSPFCPEWEIFNHSTCTRRRP